MYITIYDLFSLSVSLGPYEGVIVNIMYICVYMRIYLSS